MIVGHRGAPNLTPQNTLASFEKALDLGTDAVELDVLETADHHLVVHHDYELGNTDNGSGLINKTTLKVIRSLDAGAWFSKKFRGEKIPLFEEVLNLCRGRCRLEVELKGSSLKFLEKVLKALDKFDVILDVELTSPHIPLLHRVKKLEPRARTGLFISPYPEWMPRILGEKLITDYLNLLSAEVAHVPLILLDKVLVEKIHQSKKKIHVSDCNNEKEIIRVCRFGVDQFSTDDIILARSVIDKLNSE